MKPTNARENAMSCFVGYFVDDENEGVPVACADTHEDAQSLTIRRVLGTGMAYGQIAVRERDLTVGEAAQLRQLTDDYFAAKGVA